MEGWHLNAGFNLIRHEIARRFSFRIINIDLLSLHRSTHACSQQQLVERSLPIVERLLQHQGAYVRILASLDVDDTELLARVQELQ